MRVLLDENLPHKLRQHLAHHNAFTVAYLGWHGIQNGKLLQLAEDTGFDVFVTADRNLEEEQNWSKRRISIVFLSAHEWALIAPHITAIVEAVDAAKDGSHQRVDCGRFTRRSSSD